MFTLGSGFYSFQGDISNQETSYLSGNIAYNAGMRFFINDNIDFSVLFTTPLDFNEKTTDDLGIESRFRSTITSFGAQLDFNFKDIFKNSRIHPFASLGLMSSSFKTLNPRISSSYMKRENSIGLPVGFGLMLDISDKMRFDAALKYTINSADIDYSDLSQSDNYMVLNFAVHYDLFTRDKSANIYDQKYYADVNYEKLDIADADGDLIEEKAIELPWEELTSLQKKMTIGNLSVKDDRHTSGDLFYDSKRKENVATQLKENFLIYKDFILAIAGSNEALVSTINETCNLDDKKGKGGKKHKWEMYNFYDMPAVGALTLLSKMQSDVRNTEADIINMLRENIDAGSLKFTSAEGIQIPNSNFVLKGDSFRAQIFIAAKDTTQDPMIYVGEYDSLGGGKYEMIGDYETVKVVNGKGMFAKRATSEGNQKWGGLISMKTSSGTKTYPFRGQYLVAAKTAVVSPTNMNILYLEVDNPLKISVPGYTAGKISAVINNGKVSVQIESPVELTFIKKASEEFLPVIKKEESCV